MEITTHKLRSMSTPVFRGPFRAGNLPETDSVVPPVPPIVGDGGACAGGTATVSTSPAHIGSGGGVAGGTATVSQPTVLISRGGGVGAGVATASYTPPGPTPGTTCAAAPSIAVDNLYSYTMPASTQWWFKLPSVTSLATLKLQTTGWGSLPDWALNVYSGSCVAPLILPFIHNTSACRDWINPTAGPLWIQFSTGPSAGGPITFEISSGACP